MKLDELMRFNGTTKPFGWKQGDEDETWAQKAIEQLMKKLQKNNKEALVRMEQALKIQGRLPTQCVTIPRSLDGRLQINHRKALPHVIYCRVYRWPDLQSHHELRAIDACLFSFEANRTDICVNPYHYTRVESAGVLPPILVPRHSELPPQDVLELPQELRRLRELDGRQIAGATQCMPQNVELQSDGGLKVGGGGGGGSRASVAPTPPSVLDEPMGGLQQSGGGGGLQPGADFPGPSTSSLSTTTRTTIERDIGMEEDDEMEGTSGSARQATAQVTPQPSSPSILCNTGVSTIAVPYTNLEHWATISYYEMNTRVGEQIRVSAASIIIDGFTDPTGNPERVSLGLLSNVNRNQTVENTRRHIGRGVRLVWAGKSGSLYVECLSDCAVFVQSRALNFTHGFHPATVCKVTTGRGLRVFECLKFRELLMTAASRGFDASYELTKMSLIRMSFVKITSTPAWIEIHLHAPLMWLDHVLSHMSPSPQPISSVS